ncbi:hypothetical protein U0L90_05850 [Flavobacteriaceae sp. LMIT009]
MKKKLLLFLSLFLSVSGFYGHAQNKKDIKTPIVSFKSNVNPPLSLHEKNLIKEVYQEEFSLISESPERLRFVKNLLRNRVEVSVLNDFPKQVKLLSEVSLFNKYNAKLKRKGFDKDDFNPLSYNFDFYSKTTQIYRVDNTNYYIIIKSQYQD